MESVESLWGWAAHLRVERMCAWTALLLVEVVPVQAGEGPAASLVHGTSLRQPFS
jgi:hypothetical protein